MSTTTWSGVELRHLLALLAVADEGTFSAAAERLGYTQSAVSQQVGALERIVGASLFDRPGGPRPVRLTEAGDALVTHARAVLARLKTAEADLRALATGEQGVLRVGTLQSIGTKVLPAVLRRSMSEHPGVEIVLRESHDPLELLRLVEEGDLDITFSPLPVAGGPYETRWVLDDPFVFVAAADAPEAGQGRIALTDIVDLPLIGTRNSICLRSIEECFRGLGAEPRFVFNSDDNPTIQGCIAAGLAYGLLPVLTVDEADRSVRVLSVDPAPEPRRIGLVWHAERRPPPAQQAFVDAVTAVCAALNDRWRSNAA
ncbi:MAG: LysR family transcriptional regulator [Acidimicrobiales bacterium]